MTLNTSLTVYVPAPVGDRGRDAALSLILPGSGIVGYDDGDGLLRLYYEGNKYGAVNLATWEQRVKCAAGRAFERYPTVAMLAFIDADQVVRVGQIDNHYELTVEHPELVAEYEGRPAWPSRESPS